MGNYDCSISKRKGCNYCLRLKDVPTKEGTALIIDDKKKLKAYSQDEKELCSMDVNYCPICGREL